MKKKHDHINILIVEPDASQRKGLTLALSNSFYVTQAGSTSEAERYIEQSTFDVIITELRFKTRDGRTWLQQVLRQSPHSRLIVTTANLEPDIPETCEKMNRLHILEKPIDINHLQRIIHNIKEESG